MENKKIEQEDLEKFIKLKNTFDNIIFNLGELELMSMDIDGKKHEVRGELEKFYNEEKAFRAHFDTKYGTEGKIDLEKGEIIYG